jgi:sterol desaturase/sphingolipid hydroxylase (fatty acid hydroxylase superfamily)
MAAGSRMPAVHFDGRPIDLRAEAARSRRRLYPVSAVYSLYSLVVLALAVRAAGPWRPAGFYLAGILFWTLAEYLVHRHILHGRFPDGDGPLEHWLHTAFDTLHTEHHARPWDGDHINGTLGDTLVYVALFGALSFLAPLPTAPVFVAGFVQAYVAEEWTHHSVHFMGVYRLRGPYWRYITRHHSYHHSPRGSELAFGLTNGAWDVTFETRIPPQDRALLYRRS